MGIFRRLFEPINLNLVVPSTLLIKREGFPKLFQRHPHHFSVFAKVFGLPNGEHPGL